MGWYREGDPVASSWLSLAVLAVYGLTMGRTRTGAPLNGLGAPKRAASLTGRVSFAFVGQGQLLRVNFDERREIRCAGDR
jgi:hypothetical protein